MVNEQEYFKEQEASRVRVLSEALPYIQKFVRNFIDNLRRYLFWSLNVIADNL